MADPSEQPRPVNRFRDDLLRHEYPETVKLIGCYHARLTPSERNCFHEYVVTTDAWRQFQAVDREVKLLELSAAAGQFDEHRARNVLVLHQAAFEAMHDVSKAWVENMRCAKPAAAEPPLESE